MVYIQSKMYLRTFCPPEEMPAYSWLLQYQDHSAVPRVIRNLMKESHKDSNYTFASVSEYIGNNKELITSLLAVEKCEYSNSDEITRLAVPSSSSIYMSKQVVEKLASVVNIPAKITQTNKLDHDVSHSPAISVSDAIQTYENKKRENDVEWLVHNCYSKTLSVKMDFQPDIEKRGFKVEREYKPQTVVKSRAYPIVVYAPPNSGKTTFIKNVIYSDRSRFFDTDELFQNNGYGILFTNIPKVLQYGLFSYAIVPSKHTFEDRCKRRGLVVGSSWYDDIFDWLQYANKIFYTDEFLDEVLDPDKLVESFRALILKVNPP